MLHQRYKDLAFWGISKAALPNYLIRRYLWRAAHSKSVHLHLGCGPKYIEGFINIDANPFARIDLWLDVRNGLPFPANSADSIYATHMVEHLYDNDLRTLLKECCRILKPGAGVRLIVPSLGSAIAAYAQKRIDWFDGTFPRHYDSLGGRFSNFVFCDGQHRTAFDFGYMEEMLHSAGFRDIDEAAEGKSRLYGKDVPPYEPGDSCELPHSLYVEGFK